MVYLSENVLFDFHNNIYQFVHSHHIEFLKKIGKAEKNIVNIKQMHWNHAYYLGKGKNTLFGVGNMVLLILLWIYWK